MRVFFAEKYDSLMQKVKEFYYCLVFLLFYKYKNGEYNVVMWYMQLF